MLKYLVIMLDDTATSFCHYDAGVAERHPIATDDLRAAIVFAMKQNLSIQFVYPGYRLPAAYDELVESIDHVKIKPLSCHDGADVVVAEGIGTAVDALPDGAKACVVRTSLSDFMAGAARLASLFDRVERVNVTFSDVTGFDDGMADAYRSALASLVPLLAALYATGRAPQLNLLTDRMMLDAMNNCNAGWESLTVAPNGHFYVCPAFYHDDPSDDLGSVAAGLSVRNPQLYRLDHAPICRGCDAYHCKRCIWLNRRATLEVNTPGHRQCVMAHIERNVSAQLLAAIREKQPGFLPGRELGVTDCLDPFDKLKEL